MLAWSGRVEADDKIALSRGLGGAAIRLARAVNRVAGRRGTATMLEHSER
jgi:hypothetical protein